VGRPFGGVPAKVNLWCDRCISGHGPTTVIRVDPVFVTDRLLARPWTVEEPDLAAAYDVYSRPEVANWIGAPTEPLEVPVGPGRPGEPTA